MAKGVYQDQFLLPEAIGRVHQNIATCQTHQVECIWSDNINCVDQSVAAEAQGGSETDEPQA